MLTIHFGDMDGVVYNTLVYFNNAYSDEQLSGSFVQKMIASIDKGTVFDSNAAETKILVLSSREALQPENASANVFSL